MNIQENRINELGNTKISSLLMKYFVPSFIGTAIFLTYNIVDRIFIGQGIGANALAGVSAVLPVMMLMLAFGSLIGIGAGSRVSLNLGKKDINRAEKILGNAFILATIIGILFSIIGLFYKDQLLSFFGITTETYIYANDYLFIILIGTVFHIVGFALNNIIRSEGSLKVAMVSLLISAFLNIVLDALFVYVFDWGVKGVALSTAIAEAAVFFWTLYHFRSQKSIIKLKSINFPLRLDIVKNILSIGVSVFILQVCWSLIFGYFNMQLIKYGNDLAVAVMGIILTYALVSNQTVQALCQASQPIIGFNYGAGKFDRVKRTLIFSILWGTSVKVFCFAVYEFFPEFLIKVFNNNEELLRIGVPGMRLFMLSFPTVGLTIILGNYLQAIGKAKLSGFVILMRQVVVAIPALYFFPKLWGLNGVWLSSSLADLIVVPMVVFILVKELKELKQS